MKTRGTMKAVIIMQEDRENFINTLCKGHILTRSTGPWRWSSVNINQVSDLDMLRVIDSAGIVDSGNVLETAVDLSTQQRWGLYQPRQVEPRLYVCIM